MSNYDRLMIAKMFSLLMSVLLEILKANSRAETFARAEKQYYDFVPELGEWFEKQ